MLRLGHILAVLFIVVSFTSVYGITYEVIIPEGTNVPGCEPNRCYEPFEYQIKSGDKIIWKNEDSAAHTVTSGVPAVSDSIGKVFDSGLFLSGNTFSHTFTEKGTVDYFCIVHPWMKGRILVDYMTNLESVEEEPKQESKQTLSFTDPQDTMSLAEKYIIMKKEKDPDKDVWYFVIRYVNEPRFAQWWDHRFSDTDISLVLTSITEKNYQIEDYNCAEKGMLYLPNGNENNSQPTCEDPVGYFKRVYNFPDPNLTKQDYYKLYENTQWREWFTKWFEDYGYSLDQVIQNLEEAVIPPLTSRIGYDVNSECELAYYINYNLHYNKYGSQPFIYDKEKIVDLGDNFQEEYLNELLKKYEQWEIEARLIPEEELRETMIISMNRLMGDMADIIIEDNDINPKLKENVLAVITYPIWPDEEGSLRVLYTKSLLHPDQYGKDPSCEKKYHEYFGDKVFEDLKSLYGHDRALIVFDEIKSRIYN